MIDPYICKRVAAKVTYEGTNIKAEYQGVKLSVFLYKRNNIKAGVRYLYLKYSIIRDSYYLTDVI